MEAEAVRRFYVALLSIVFAVPLLAADPAFSLLGTPTLLVYPFAVNGSDVNREAGSRLAVTIAEKIANLGGVIVKPAPPGVERLNYLEAAHHEGVAYYISGYVTPLGDGVSVVEQLVSTQTGIVVFSNTAQVRTFEDAAGQGDVLREALLRHQTRNLGAYAAPPPPAATPTPVAGSGGQANLGRLFGRRQKRATASASPSPSPASRPAVAAKPVAPSPTPVALGPSPAPPAVSRGTGYGMLAIGGPADTDRRTFAVAAIRNVMIANHQRVALSGPQGARTCSDTAIGTLLGGNLSMRNHTILGQPQTLATLELLAYDCSGSIVYRKTFVRDSRGDWKVAVNRVVQSAVAEFLREPPTRRS